MNRIVRHNMIDLIGKWSTTNEFTDDYGYTSFHTESYTFYKNGMMKWIDRDHGFEMLTDKYRYHIEGDYIVGYSELLGKWMVTSFRIDDNRLTLCQSDWQRPLVLTKQV